MINRLGSSYSQFQSTISEMSRANANLAKNKEQFASGKEVLTAGDDPVATIAIQNTNQEQVEIGHYLKNIKLANNRLSNEETVLDSIETISDAFKQKALAMNSAALSSADRLAYKADLEAMYDELFDLANTRDEAGKYIFAGGDHDSPAFVRDGDGRIKFQGDSNVAKAAISSTTDIKTNDSGKDIFFFENSKGDYKANYDLADGSTTLIQKATNTITGDKENSYSVEFKKDVKGNVTYTLFDKDSNPIKDQEDLPYDPVKGIEYTPDAKLPDEKLSIKFLKNKILDGDKVTLEPCKEINVFDVMHETIELAGKSNADANVNAQTQEMYAQLDAGYVQISQVRSDVGTRMNTLDTQKDIHTDFNIELEKTRSSLEDLDYSTAFIDYMRNYTAIEASNKAFTKTQQLSLFNYI